MIDHSNGIVKFIDGVSFATVGATILGWAPGIAAVFAAAWYCVLFYDRFFGVKKPSSLDLPQGD